MATIGLSYTDPAMLLTIAVDRTSFSLWHVTYAGTPAHSAMVKRFLDTTPPELLPVVMVRGLDQIDPLVRALAAVEQLPRSVIVFDSPDRLAAAGVRVMDAEEVEPGRWEEARLDLGTLNEVLALEGLELAPAGPDGTPAPEEPELDELPEENEYGPRFVRRRRRGGGAGVVQAGEVVPLTPPDHLGDFAPLEQSCPCETPAAEERPIFDAAPGTLGYLLHAIIHDMQDAPDEVITPMLEYAVGMATADEWVRRGRPAAMQLGAPEDALAALGWWRESARGAVTAYYVLNDDLVASCPEDVLQDVEMVLALVNPRRRHWARPPRLPPEQSMLF